MIQPPKSSNKIFTFKAAAENVKGMNTPKMAAIFKKTYDDLTSCGYEVKVFLLNSKNFLVPQSRERIFFMGVRK